MSGATALPRCGVVFAVLLLLSGCAAIDQHWDRPVSAMRRVPPAYPGEAGTQDGHVTVAATVGADGLPTNIRVVKSEPAGVFDTAVVNAFGHWRFRPKLIAGKVVVSDVQVTFNFDSKFRVDKQYLPAALEFR